MAAALVIVLVVALVVWRPWSSAVTGTAHPTPAATTQPPTVSASPTGSAVGAPTILAHRGGLEQHQFETQAAMEAAAAAGFDVETDVRFTSDGVAVLVHDERATRGLDCGGRQVRVSKTTWADLNQYCRSKPTAKDPAQYPVPRLDDTMEGIAAASADVDVYLQVKTTQTPKQRTEFLDAPARYGLRDRTVVTASRLDWLDAIRSAAPQTRRMLFVSGKPVPSTSLKAAGLWGVGVEQGVATRQYVADLHDAGLKVMIWVLNDQKAWPKFVGYGPDVVMTAYPERFKAWLAAR